MTVPTPRQVREFMIHNALYWLEEFHLDGLRLDAVHAIIDDSPRHLLRRAGRTGPRRAARRTATSTSCSRTTPTRRAGWSDATSGRVPWYDAQWADDLHHGLHVAATGEGNGYYRDYHGDVGKLGRALAEGFAFQGEPSAFKGGEPRGEPSAHLPPTAFVSFLQNHDQIGNRAHGRPDRRAGAARSGPRRRRPLPAEPGDPDAVHGRGMGDDPAVPVLLRFRPRARRGRPRAAGARSSRAFPSSATRRAASAFPTPRPRGPFALARLPWAELGSEPHAGWLAWYRRVLATRRERILPLLPRIGGGAGSFEVIGPMALRVAWRARRRSLADGARQSLGRARAGHRRRRTATCSGAKAARAVRPTRLPRRLGGGLAPGRARPPRPAGRTDGHRACLRQRRRAGSSAPPPAPSGRCSRPWASKRTTSAPPRPASRRSRPPSLRAPCRRSWWSAPTGLPAHVELTLPPARARSAGRIAEEAGTAHEGSGRVRTRSPRSPPRARQRGGDRDPLARRCPARCRRATTRLRVEARRQRRRGWPLIVVPPRCYLPDAIARGRADLGHRGPALHGALRTRLGHGRFRRPADPGGPRRRAGAPT